MYGFWYDYLKLKNGEKTKLCYIDTDSFIVYIKTKDIYIDVADYVETRFCTSNYKLTDHYLKEKIKNYLD